MASPHWSTGAQARQTSLQILELWWKVQAQAQQVVEQVPARRSVKRSRVAWVALSSPAASSAAEAGWLWGEGGDTPGGRGWEGRFREASS